MGSETTHSSREQPSHRISDGTESAGISTIPEDSAEDIKKFRETDDGKKLAQWVLTELDKAASARLPFENQWRENLLYARRRTGPIGVAEQIAAARNGTGKPKRLRINRIRSFIRGEHSKFTSQEPVITVVPSSSEDMDFRAASSGEQAWRSMSSAGMLNHHVSEAQWWKVVTGNGFLKTYWDGGAVDPVSGERGVVRYGAVSPFHLFVPDLREPSLEDQPFVINGHQKSMSWARQRFGDAMKGCSAGELSINTKLQAPANRDITEYPESVTILEVWVKPGATKLLPNGGLIHMVGNTLVGLTRKMPYNHGAYPYAHSAHITTGVFYRDSAVDDLIGLQEEYNEIRSNILHASRVAGRPQFAVTKGGYTIARHTNEAGLIVEVNPGFQPPTPLAMPELPQYVQAQQDRILTDFEDISGQHEVSRGQAPGGGVTAGTAIAYLQESDDQYLTPQYRSDEEMYEKIAKQSLELFVQYVDAKRKVKSVGADRGFDVSLLAGADIKNGTDVRVEKGSAISTSQVAKRAEIKEMVGLGIISPERGLDLLEMGGAERLRETADIARAKAQRENIQIQNLNSNDLLAAEDAAVLQAKNAPIEEIIESLGGAEMLLESGMSPEDAPAMLEEQVRAQMPPAISAADFDLHELHIDVHNQYRMSQAYEQLDDRVKAEFEKHIASHEQFLMQRQVQQMQSAQGFPEMAPPTEAEIAENLNAGNMTVPAPGSPNAEVATGGEGLDDEAPESLT